MKFYYITEKIMNSILIKIFNLFTCSLKISISVKEEDPEGET